MLPWELFPLSPVAVATKRRRSFKKAHYFGERLRGVYIYIILRRDRNVRFEPRVEYVDKGGYEAQVKFAVVETMTNL
jgi:hypothetical protein